MDGVENYLCTIPTFNQMAKERLHRASRVMPKSETDTILRSKILDGHTRAYNILYEAQQYWSAMETFRRDRERNKKYTYGKQWDDYVCVDGVRMSEEEYIKKQGNVPLKNNLIKPSSGSLFKL